MTDEQTTTERITIRLPKFDLVFFLALELHYLAIIGFSLFGLLNSGTSFLSGTAEDIYRFWLALLGAVVAYFFSRDKVLIPILIFLAAIQHWLIPLGIGVFASSDAKNWRELASLPSGATFLTGYQSAMLVADIALLVALIGLVLSRPKQVLQLLKVIALSPQRVASWVARPLESMKPGQLLLGIGLSIQVFYVILLYAIGITTRILYTDSGSIAENVALGFSLVLAIALVLARWQRSKLIVLAIVTSIWNFLIFPVILNSLEIQGAASAWRFLIEPNSDARFRTLTPVLEISSTMNGLSQAVVLVALVLIALFAIVRRYAAAVARWFDARHLEVYGSRPPVIGSESPREVSVTAVLSLIFAFFSPIIGLILSYSARNTIVHSQGRKTGLELTVAAAIISWFFIFIVGGLIFLSALAPVLGIPSALDVLWQIIFSPLGM